MQTEYKTLMIRKKKPLIATIDNKLDLLLQIQKKVLRTEGSIQKETAIEEAQEEAALRELQNLENIEQEIKHAVEPHPLQRITLQDMARGVAGAFFGAVAHYTFVYGIHVADNLTLTRAILLYPLSLSIGGFFLYATSFRKITDPQLLKYFPLRLFTLYMTALFTSVFVLVLFQPTFGAELDLSIKQLATVTLSAMVGAATADLIGTTK